jgi:outer membrane lipoprotein-sorting protein
MTWRIKMFKIIPALLCALLSVSALATQDADDILAKADGYRNFKGKPFSFDLQLINKEEGETDKSFALRAEVQNSHRSLVVYAEPAADRGKALLMDANNLWFSSPGTSRPLRITPQQRLIGEASNGDVASTDLTGDYAPSLQGSETIDGVPCRKLELVAKPDTLAAYAKLTLWVKESNSQPVKADFFGPSGKLLKTAYYRRYASVPQAGGAQQLVELEIVNAINSGKRTVMKYANFALGDVPDSHFSPAYLARLR